MRNIFLKKSYKNVLEKLVRRSFSGKLKLRISLDQWAKVLCSLFLLNPKGYRNLLKLSCFQLLCNHLFLPHFKHIKKNKKRFESACLIFWITFEENFFSCYNLFMDHVSLPGCFYFLRYWAICVLQLLLTTRL